MKLNDFPCRPYQYDIVTNLMRKVKQHALFVEVGGGKSLCVIAHAETHPKIKKTIIFCRKDNIKTWRDEIKKWHGSKYVQVKGSPALRLHNIEKFFDDDKYKYLIINYDAPKVITRVGKSLENKIFNILIDRMQIFDYGVFDEVIEVKNSQSDRHRYVYKLVKEITRRSILDGCPVTINAMDLFGQFLIMDDGRTFGTNFFSFRNKYFRCTNIDYMQWELKPGGLEAMHEKMSKVAIRLKKRDVRDDLPPQSWQRVYPEMTGKQNKYYQQMLEEFYVKHDKGEISVKHTIVQIQKLHQIANGFLYLGKGKDREIVTFPCNKADSLHGLLSGDLRGEKQLVIWAKHTESLKQIKKICEKHGRKAVTYHGQLTDREKDSRRDAFLNREVNDFIGQGRAGVGLNELSNASVTVYWSNEPSLRAREQTEGRIDRDSEEKKTRNHYIDIVMRGTIEEHICDQLNMKKWKSDNVLSFKSIAEIRKAI